MAHYFNVVMMKPVLYPVKKSEGDLDRSPSRFKTEDILNRCSLKQNHSCRSLSALSLFSYATQIIGTLL